MEQLSKGLRLGGHYDPRRQIGHLVGVVNRAQDVHFAYQKEKPHLQ